MTGLFSPIAPRVGRRARLAAAGLTGAVLLVAGCSGSDTGPAATSAAATASTAATSPPGTAGSTTASALTDTGWKLTGLLSDGTTTAVDPTLNGWVRFAPAADGLQVAFNTTCNQGGGSATITGDEITFGPQRTTLIYCDGPSGSTETAMLALFDGTRAVAVDQAAGTLSITSTDGASGLTFVADPTVGTDAFEGGPGAGSSTSTTAASSSSPG